MLSEVKGCILSLRSSDFTKKRTINKYHAAQYSGKGNGNPLQYSCLENPMEGGAWWASVHGVARSWTRLRDFTFTFHFHALEKEMATHSSVLAWRIPETGEPGGLPSMGSHRVGHDCATSLSLSLFKSLQMVIAAMKLKDAYSLEEKL